MRRGVIITGLLGGLAAAGAANAATTSSTPMSVSANAPQVCTVQQPVLSQGALVNFQALDGTNLRIDQLTDPSTLATAAASVSVSFDAVCNYPHRIVLESQNNGLWRTSTTAPAPTGFADAVPYTAQLTWGTINNTFRADAKARRLNTDSIPVDNPTAGKIVLNLSIQAGDSNLSANAPLIAGIYGDTLRVTVEPQ
jgi:hypothetical protein